MINWTQSLNCAITVCDRDGIIIYMNDKSANTWAKQGGESLIGKSLFGCHSQRSTEIIHKLMQTGQSNTYTVEKNGVKKLIYQTPWFEDDQVAGMVEFSIVLPAEIPHYVRK